MKYGLLAIGIAPVIWVVGSGQEYGGVYSVPMAEAQRLLARTPLPPLVFGTEPVSLTRSDSGATMVWIVRKNGAEVLRYVAILSPEGEGSTRVTLTIRGATQGPFGNVEQRLADNESIRDLYLTAMDERIAAALERRRMNMTRIYRATASATVANIGAINARFDRAAAEYRRRDRENIEKAYRDEAAGRSY